MSNHIVIAVHKVESAEYSVSVGLYHKVFLVPPHCLLAPRLSNVRQFSKWLPAVHVFASPRKHLSPMGIHHLTVLYSPYRITSH